MLCQSETFDFHNEVTVRYSVEIVNRVAARLLRSLCSKEQKPKKHCASFQTRIKIRSVFCTQLKGTSTLTTE